MRLPLKVASWIPSQANKKPMTGTEKLFEGFLLEAL